MCQLDSHQPPRFSLFGSASFRPRRKYVGRRCQKPVLRRCLQAAVSAAPWKKTCGMLPHTNCRSYKTLKINGWNIIPWRWMEDHFLSFHGWFVGSMLIFQGVNLMLGTLRSLLLQRLSHGHIFHCEMSGGRCFSLVSCWRIERLYYYTCSIWAI